MRRLRIDYQSRPTRKDSVDWTVRTAGRNLFHKEEPMDAKDLDSATKIQRCM